jgi:plasmid stabilization system protein ParE
MKKLRFSEMAERDLDQIWTYIATKSGNIDTAKRFVESLVSRLSILALESRAGTVRDGIDEGLRGLPIGRYVVNYRDEDALVLILRIIHGSREQGTAYYEDLPDD